MSLDTLCDTHTITVERPSMPVDSSGGTTRVSWAAVDGLTSLPCAIQPVSARDRILFQQHQVTVSDRIYLSGDYSSLIQRSDRIRETTSGRIFRITGAFDVAGQGQLTRLEVFEFIP